MNREIKRASRALNLLSRLSDKTVKSSESHIYEDAQKGGIHMMIDIDFSGIIPSKQKIETVFKKHKEIMLKSMDKEFKELGFDKKGDV